MTAKNRADLNTDVATLLADNTSGDISALDVRTVAINSLDSALNLLADTSDVLTEGATKLLLTTTERGRIAREWNTATYVNGVNYTAGVSVSLTLPVAAPGNDKDYVRVFYEGIQQVITQWSIAGT